MRTGDGSTGYLPVDIDCKHYLNIISHVYTANNKMEATVVLIHYNTTHLVQFKDRYLFLEAELYRWMYDGYTTGCNRSKRFLSVRRFQQFQLELSHQQYGTGQDGNELGLSRCTSTRILTSTKHRMGVPRNKLMDYSQLWILPLAQKLYKATDLVDTTHSTANSLLIQGDRDLFLRSSTQ